MKPDLIWMISFFAMAPSLAKWPESWGASSMWSIWVGSSDSFVGRGAALRIALKSEGLLTGFGLGPAMEAQ